MNMKKIMFIIIYWILSLTWGLLMSITGFIAVIIALLLKGKPHRNGCSLIVEIGENWGGLNLGCFALCGSYYLYNRDWFEKTRRHEFGHSIQNIIFGPFHPFVVGIPSAIRYWYNRLSEKHGKKFPADWYDSIWFEGTATKWGTKIINWLH